MKKITQQPQTEAQRVLERILQEINQEQMLDDNNIDNLRRAVELSELTETETRQVAEQILVNTFNQYQRYLANPQLFGTKIYGSLLLNARQTKRATCSLLEDVTHGIYSGHRARIKWDELTREFWQKYGRD